MLGGYKLKLKDVPLWVTLPQTPDTDQMLKYYRNPQVEFSFNIFQHDVNLYNIKTGVEADIERAKQAAIASLKGTPNE